MMETRFFLHAVNVHQGGGKALLEALFQALASRKGCVLLLDARMPVPAEIMGIHQVMRIYPSVFHRFRAEWWLARQVRPSDIVLCFGNLPTLFRVKGRAIVFVQNKYLLEDGASLAGFSWKTRLRISIERFWFKWKAANVDQFIVQTPAMKAALQVQLGSFAAGHQERMAEDGEFIQMLPFVKVTEGYRRKLPVLPGGGGNDYDFLYVASGEPHKNHRKLIEAWCLLAAENHFPSLALTVDETHFSDLCRWMQEKKLSFGLKLINLGTLPNDQVKQLYGQVGAIIQPSIFESFGLPLIEARQAGLPILASELDYVRDVIDPEESFDPSSAVSIARAVKRYLGVAEAALPLLDGEGFLNKVLVRTEQSAHTYR